MNTDTPAASMARLPPTNQRTPMNVIAVTVEDGMPTAKIDRRIGRHAGILRNATFIRILVLSPAPRLTGGDWPCASMR